MIIFGLTTGNYKDEGKLDFLIKGNIYTIDPEDVDELHCMSGVPEDKRFCVIHDGMRLRMWDRMISNNSSVFYSQHASITSLFVNNESDYIPTLRMCFEEAEIVPVYLRSDPRFLRDIEKLYHYYVSTFM